MDILESVFLVVPCSACGGTYEVSARTARSSEAMLHDGCPVQSTHECPQTHYASLIDPEALDDLCRAWARVEAAARSHGSVAIVRSIETHAVAAQPPAEAQRVSSPDRTALK